MIDSSRVRLTLWYTGFLAVILVAFSVSTYLLLARITLRRTDAALAELGSAFRDAIQQELRDEKSPGSLRSAAVESFQEFRLRDHLFAVFDTNGTLLAASGTNDEANAIFSAPPVLNLIAAAQSGRAFGTVRADSVRYRAYAMRLSPSRPAAVVVVLQSLNREEILLEDIVE